MPAIFGWPPLNFSRSAHAPKLYKTTMAFNFYKKPDWYINTHGR